jgi:hypothetical protein
MAIRWAQATSRCILEMVDSDFCGFWIHKHKILGSKPRLLRKSLTLDKETERLVSEVKRELRALRVKVDQRDDPKLLKTYRKIRSSLD